MKTIVRSLNLKNDPQLISTYKKVHDEIWPEITAGIKSVGISRMDIYLLGQHAVMIIEYPDDLDIDKAFDKLSTLPRQSEWEEYVSRFQECKPGSSSAEKWQNMSKIFSLPS